VGFLLPELKDTFFTRSKLDKWVKMDIPSISVEVIINMGFMADWDVEIPQ